MLLSHHFIKPLRHSSVFQSLAF